MVFPNAFTQRSSLPILLNGPDNPKNCQQPSLTSGGSELMQVAVARHPMIDASVAVNVRSLPVVSALYEHVCPLNATASSCTIDDAGRPTAATRDTAGVQTDVVVRTYVLQYSPHIDIPRFVCSVSVKMRLFYLGTVLADIRLTAVCLFVCVSL